MSYMKQLLTVIYEFKWNCTHKRYLCRVQSESNANAYYKIIRK